MFKGTTKIELIDTRNGHIDTYEDSNMFTNGISQVLNYSGIMDNNKFESNLDKDTYLEKASYSGVLSNSQYPTINSLTGGLLLFSDYVTESANQISIPANNKITARACLENNESTQSGEKNGSLTDSSFTDKHKYKYVWEFNENQANGDISCVCLTTPIGAVKAPVDSNSSEITYNNRFPYKQHNWECVNDGIGDASNTLLNRAYQTYGDEEESMTVSEFNALGSSGRPKSFFKDGVVLADLSRDCLYTLYTDTSYASFSLDKNLIYNLIINKKLKLKKYRFPFKQFSLFDDRTIKNKRDDYSSIVELSFPDVFDTEIEGTVWTEWKQTLAFSNDDNYLYVYFFTTNMLPPYYNLKNTSYAMNIVNNAFIFQFRLSDFSFVKYWNISYDEIGVYLCSWKSTFINSLSIYADANNPSWDYSNRNNSKSICNSCNDFCVSNDKLYFFGKYNDGEGGGEGLDKDIYLLSYDLNNGYLKQVKFNGTPIIIVEKDGYSNNNYKYGNYGTDGDRGYYNGYEFSLGNPYVSMVNSSQETLLITFLPSGKTYQINNNQHDQVSEENLYLKYNSKINNPFWLDETYTLENQIRPLEYPDEYKLSFLYHPLKENILYSYGSFIKIKSKFNKTFKDPQTNKETYLLNSVNAIYTVKFWSQDYSDYIYVYDYINDYGCYDIIQDPTMLVTINNLSTRIQKKNYQRMKVTYTITEVL